MNFQQQGTTIKSPQAKMGTEASGPQMTDRDRCNDILSTEKYLTDGLNIFTREASNQQLFGDIKQILNETQDCARDVYNLMYQEGWYTLKTAEQQEIQQSKQQFANYLQSQSPY